MSRLALGEELVERREIFDLLYPVGTISKSFEHVAAVALAISRPMIARSISLAENLTSKQKAEIRAVASPAKRAKLEARALAQIKRQAKLNELAVRAAARIERCGADRVGRCRIDLGDNAEWLRRYRAQGITFDMVLTDPPYSLRWSKISHDTRSSLNEEPSWDDLDVGWLFRVAPVLSKHSTVVVFCPAEAIGVYREVFGEIGLDYRGALVWHKTNPAPQHRPGYIQATEFLVWATRGKPFFQPWENAGAREAHNLIELPACHNSERLGHPTQKPLRLLEQILDRHAIEGALILDPFAGVGSTVVAAMSRGLVAFGIELDQTYHKIAVDRIAAFEPPEPMSCAVGIQKS